MSTGLKVKYLEVFPAGTLFTFMVCPSMLSLFGDYFYIDSNPLDRSHRNLIPVRLKENCFYSIFLLQECKMDEHIAGLNNKKIPACLLLGWAKILFGSALEGISMIGYVSYWDLEMFLLRAAKSKVLEVKF